MPIWLSGIGHRIFSSNKTYVEYRTSCQVSEHVSPSALLCLHQAKLSEPADSLAGRRPPISNSAISSASACAGESLANGVTAHGLAVATDQHAVGPGPLSHVSGEDGQHVRRNGDSAFASVRLGWCVEGFPRGEEFGAMISPRRRPHHAPSRTAARY